MSKSFFINNAEIHYEIIIILTLRAFTLLTINKSGGEGKNCYKIFHLRFI